MTMKIVFGANHVSREHLLDRLARLELLGWGRV